MSAARPGQRRHATMRDVAALAGVGLKTVSRVVNGEPNVSAETTERVERAIEALGFERTTAPARCAVAVAAPRRSG